MKAWKLAAFIAGGAAVAAGVMTARHLVKVKRSHTNCGTVVAKLSHDDKYYFAVRLHGQDYLFRTTQERWENSRVGMRYAVSDAQICDFETSSFDALKLLEEEPVSEEISLCEDDCLAQSDDVPVSDDEDNVQLAIEL